MLSLQRQSVLPAGLVRAKRATADMTGWVLTFLSFTMLLLNQWSIAVGLPGLPMVMIILFLLPWLWIILRQPSFALHNILSNFPLLALPLLALTSATWSNYPAWSARAGTQFVATTIVGIVAATCIKPRLLLSALLCALALVAVLSVISGRTAPIGLTGEYALVGLFGSKNYFGLCVSILFLVAIAVGFDRNQPKSFRMLGLVAVFLAPVLLKYAKSTGAIFVCLVVAAIIFGLHVDYRLMPQFRAALICVAALFLTLFMVVSTLNIDEIQNILSYFGKDVTLTGRTFLWDHAFISIDENPLLGVGYQAYWQPGNPGAEELWLFAGISNKYGFHFHNTYLQVAVDLGVTGLIILVATLAAMVMRVLATAVGPRPRPEQLFAVAGFMFLLLRTPIEVDLFFQFSVPTLMLCITWVYLRRPARP